MRKRYTLYNIYRWSATACLFLLAFVGQAQVIDTTDMIIRYETEEYIYAFPGVEGSITLQELNEQGYAVTDNLDGYIRWFTLFENKEGVTGLSLNDESISSDGNMLSMYDLGYAWTATDTDATGGTAGNGVSVIKYEFDETQIKNNIVVVCDASSVMAELIDKDGIKKLRPCVVSIRHKYIVKLASERLQTLQEKQEEFKKLQGGNYNDIKALLQKNDRSDCLLYEYEIHTPIETGTNYRLPERLSNYFVSDNQAASKVRWHFYDEDSTIITDNTLVTEKPVVTYTFPQADLDMTKQHHRYILVEVGDGTDTNWMPVSLLHVVLEPYSKPLTQTELEAAYKEDPLNYQYRMVEDLVEKQDFRRIVNLSMERSRKDTLNFEQVSPQENFVINPDGMTSYYAFAEPAMAEFRDNKHKLSVGRGEYALYRTLNYPKISKVGDDYPFISTDGTQTTYTVHYNDWFATGGYPVKVVDRLCEKTGGKQSGYFMYIDAADEPSVIAKFELGETLCEHTSLIVSAWVCDLRTKMTNDWTSADIGFTFKKKNTDGTETILSKFYTGNITRKPHNTPLASDSTQALWQQVSFDFSIPETLKDGEMYLLEIANNCAHSLGADYGIDDIQVFVSTPNIRVQRANACEASVLEVRSDYHTLRKNMGWDLNPDVLESVGSDKLEKLSFRRFRYGLMGKDPKADLGSIDKQYHYLGNVYLGFIQDLGSPGTDAAHWVTVNKAAESALGDNANDPDKAAFTKSIRVAVPTYEDLNAGVGSANGDMSFIPTSKDEALDREYILNVRAMHDFLHDVEERKWENGLNEMKGITTESDLYTNLKKVFDQLWDSTEKDANLEAIKANYESYNRSVADMFLYLGIPRIRCPWKSEDGNILYLDAIDVYNTDLKFAGEKYIENGEVKEADGKYNVVLFNAVDVASVEEGEHIEINVNDPCTIKSEFYVIPSITIAIDTEAQTNSQACLGEIHTLNAKLMVADVDELGNVSGTMVPFDEKYGENGKYIFDWFLGPMTEYTASYSQLESILDKFRSSLSEDEKFKSFSAEDVQDSGLEPVEKDLLISLLGDESHEPKLLSGNSISFRWVGEVVAIPYASSVAEGDKKLLFCTDAQQLKLDVNTKIPELLFGFSDVTSYPDETDVKLFNAPLRLGLRHIWDENTPKGKSLVNIPIREKIKLVMEGNCLRNIKDKEVVYLRKTPNAYIPVGTLENLYADEFDTEGKNRLSFTFSEPEGHSWADLFKEGSTYSLYIPFGEYKDDKLIEGSCTGYAVLDIKIVPEYLTWKGGTDAVWYNDDNWDQSTQAELYMGGNNDDTDANGSDPIENAFAPLYFTKVTIDPEKGDNTNVLGLEDESRLRQEGQHNTLDLSKWTSPGSVTNDIQYDMAVNNTGTCKAIEVVPYYGNKVSEIYFKPDAKLVNQHYLDYEKAWVEFEMDNNEKRWFASPLQNVYAGDFYAPKDNGRQETEAFKDINYNAANTNSRWAPAFYQKAWNSAIKYATKEDGNSSETVAAVKSNWSIEYNDVTVSYPIGKGFYLSVEEVPTTNGGNGTALVRLPKADAVADYQYEAATKASVLRADEYPKEKSGQLAAYKNTDGILKVKLSDLFGESENDVTGEGSTSKKRHFLVGNPYMTYLDMNEFFTNNTVLGNKYWTLTDGTVNATVVGTPDVPFEGEYTTGTVAPMQAFFVELAENATVDESSVITFTPDMMSATEIAKGGATTKGATATNPVITITAERGEIKSVARLSTSDRADNGYKADEDAVVLLDSELDAPMVYTVAGSLAAQVNAVKNIHNIGLGLYNDSREEVTITINGLSRLANRLYLYDAHTGKSVKMESDSYSMTIGGDSHGRYYLRDSELGSELDNAISIQSTQRGRVIVSAIRPVKKIKVFSLSGSQVRGFSVNSTQYGFDLPAGIYMIYASDGEREHTEKVIVR